MLGRPMIKLLNQLKRSAERIAPNGIPVTSQDAKKKGYDYGPKNQSEHASVSAWIEINFG
jgi:hypothetical protein